LSKKRALTGIKPTGAPHIANYIGAIRPALALTDEYDSFYFIADYHALTTVRDPKELRDLTYEVAAAWLAMGLDPENSTLYRQSDLPETFELAWILNCITPKGMMNRAHAYKAAVDAAREQAGPDDGVDLKGGHDLDAGINMGVYDYPVLMAADIILFSSHVVPVGKDQSQHIEYARDIAQRFNHAYGNTLRVPELLLSPTAANIVGSDGRKMSKSYGNQIPLFAESPALKKIIRRYKTDSSGANDPKDAEASGLFQIYREIVSAEDAAALKKTLETGEMTWGALKDLVFETVDAFLEEPRARYRELMADVRQIDRILIAGAERARPEARALMARTREAIGRVELQP
jgi:tryptophanyl-tRNA synthetase